jgi:hypothetical protein
MNLRPLVFLLAAAMACGGALAQSAPASANAAANAAQRPGDIGQRWQIAFDDTSQSDGQIRFLLWQHDEDAPTELTIDVAKGDTPNRIAVKARDSFRETLGSRDYNVNIAKGNVWITAKRGERRFALQLAENGAAGVQIDTYREGR